MTTPWLCKSGAITYNGYGKLFKDFSYTFIELDKFHKSADELASTLDKWIYFFKHAEEGEDFPSKLIKEPSIHEALDEMKAFNWSQAELLAYEKIEDEHFAYLNNMELAEAEGILKGKFEVAKNLKQLGLTEEQISKATGLSVAGLRQIK